MNEVDAGRKILKKLYKRIKAKDALVAYKEGVDTLLTAAIKVCRRLDQICTSDSADYTSLMNLHEEAGDNYADLKNFSQAVYHYTKAVEVR
jgi:two-component SAPR family response regulator